MRIETRRGIHTLTGLVPLAVFLAFHLWEHWPAVTDRGLVLARMRSSSAAAAEVIFVFLPLLAHAVLGLGLSREPDPLDAHTSPAFRRLQMLTGLVTAVFVVWHVSSVWLVRVTHPDGARASLAMLADQLGQMWGAGAYLLGVSAACVHFSQGLAAAWIRRRKPSNRRFVRAFCGGLGVLIWVMFVDVLAAYAAGAALL